MAKSIYKPLLCLKVLWLKTVECWKPLISKSVMDLNLLPFNVYPIFLQLSPSFEGEHAQKFFKTAMPLLPYFNYFEASKLVVKKFPHL